MGRAYSASNLTMHLSSWSFMGYLRIQWNFRYENAIGTAVEVQNIIEVSNLGRLVHACISGRDFLWRKVVLKEVQPAVQHAKHVNKYVCVYIWVSREGGQQSGLY